MTGTALIGLGAIGRGMAKNILAAGIPLRGYDLSAEARATFAAAGGEPKDTAGDATAGCDLLVVMVVDAAQANQALFEEDAAAALTPGATVMLCSTVAPSEARAIGHRLAEAGHMMLDAPVSGGQVGAEAGTLTVMASGPEGAFRRAEPVLEAISGTVHRLGDAPGLGATYKVVHQLAAGVHLVAAAELLTLGAKAGCDPAKLLDIVGASAGRSWMMGDRGPRMLMADAPVTSAVDIFVKDLGLVLATGRDCRAPLPLSAVSHQMMLAASAMGLGRADDSAVARAYEALAAASLTAYPKRDTEE